MSGMIITARACSRCPECNRKIVPGHEITKLTTGRWVHAWCAPLIPEEENPG